VPFSSLTFIFVYFPIALLLFYCLPYRIWRNAILALSSIGFFAWSDPTHIHVLIFAVLINFYFGKAIGGFNHKGRLQLSKTIMWIAVSINILTLCFYKYTGFFFDIIRLFTDIPVISNLPSLPLGVSFFTFTGISYILDVYNNIEEHERNLITFSAYMAMFPKLLQGPITRYKQVRTELQQPRYLPEGILVGIRRFIAGLAKKVLLADSLGVATTKIFNADISALGADLAWFGLIAYTLQIYLDFSGYTDMAIGLGKIFGFTLPENFNFPYISKSISEFWRRWHMTLTAWFRTYLFLPLEFARKKSKYLRQQSNLLIVFLLTGLWHGASWNFVVWGIYFGLILALEASGINKLIKKLPILVQHFYTLVLVMIGWVFFRLVDIQDWGLFFKALLGHNGISGITTFRSLNIIYYIPFIIPSGVLCFPLLNKFKDKIERNSGIWLMLLDIFYLCLFIFTLTYILAKGFNAFMYAQF